MLRLQVFRAVSLMLAVAGCTPTGGAPAPTGGSGGSGGVMGGAAGSPPGSGGAGGRGGAGGSTGGSTGGTTAGAGGSGGASGGGGGTSGTGGSPPADARPPGDTGAVEVSGSPDLAGDRATPGGPGKIVLVAGGLQRTFGVAVDPMTGDVYSADHGDSRIRKIDGMGRATVVVGPGAPGPGGQVTLDRPHDLRFQPGTRNLFIADTMASRVVRWDAATGQVTVIAGQGGKVPAGGNTYSLTFDAGGSTLYFTGGGGVRVMDLRTETLKATLEPGNMRVIAMDSKGTLYAVRSGGNALQTVNPLTGAAANVPGGSPVSAPKGLTTDNEDNVIIVDTEIHSIRKYVVATRTIVRLVGNGMEGTGRLDGPPELAQTDRPHGAVVDKDGRLLIADSFNNRILAIVY